MARSSGGGLVGRLLAPLRGRGGGGQAGARGAAKAPADASIRLEAARKRLKDEIPPPDESAGPRPPGNPAP